MLNIHFTNHSLSHKPTEQFKVTDDSSPIVSNGDYQEKPQMKMVLQVSQRSLLHLDSAGIGLDKPLSGQNLTHKIMTRAVTRFCPDKASLWTRR